MNTDVTLTGDDMHITPHVPTHNWPQMMQDCLQVMNHPSTKDMLMMSILTATSSVMDRVYFRYAHYGKCYYPNLLTFIMAGAASGKGVADLATRLVEPIHQEKSLMIAGDSTYPAFYEQLRQQDGKGLLFETEGSVITDVWKSGCTHYNTALRKCAEHETLSKARLTTGQSSIECPKVSMLLTGTCSQFKQLVPGVENGFFSRLNMLVIRDKVGFDGTVFQPNDHGLKVEQVLGYWAEKLKQWYDAQTEPVEFRLTEQQARKIGTVMEGEYGAYLQQLGDGFHATIVRNGITLMRIAAILTVLRTIETGPTDFRGQALRAIPDGRTSWGPDPIQRGLDPVLTCCDEDFETAMIISTKLLLHAADAYNQIGGQDQTAMPKAKGCYQKETFFASLPPQFSTGECIKQASSMGVSERMAKYWIDGWHQTGIVSKVGHGQYTKVA